MTECLLCSFELHARPVTPLTFEPITSAVIWKIHYSNLCIRFGTWWERRMNQPPLQRRIVRQTLPNLMLFAAPNRICRTELNQTPLFCRTQLISLVRHTSGAAFGTGLTQPKWKNTNFYWSRLSYSFVDSRHFTSKLISHTAQVQKQIAIKSGNFARCVPRAKITSQHSLVRVTGLQRSKENFHAGSWHLANNKITAQRKESSKVSHTTNFDQGENGFNQQRSLKRIFALVWKDISLWLKITQYPNQSGPGCSKPD